MHLKMTAMKLIDVIFISSQIIGLLNNFLVLRRCLTVIPSFRAHGRDCALKNRWVLRSSPRDSISWQHGQAERCIPLASRLDNVKDIARVNCAINLNIKLYDCCKGDHSDTLIKLRLISTLSGEVIYNFNLEVKIKATALLIKEQIL